MPHHIYDELEEREKKVGWEFAAGYKIDYNKIGERMREK
jgi:hypothetical protein